MNVELKVSTLQDAATEKSDVLVVLVDAKAPAKWLKKHPGALQDWLSAMHDNKDWPKAFACVSAYGVAACNAKRLLVVGLPEAAQLKDVHKAMGVAWSACKASQPTQVVVFAQAWSEAGLKGAVQGLADASYVYTASLGKPESTSLSSLTLCAPKLGALKSALTQASAVAKGVELAKECANRPPNLATPTYLAQVAQGLASDGIVQTEVLERDDVQKLGMGAFLAVAKGSIEPLKFIVMKYQGGAADQAPIALVGKGITFDTGGISLKPAPEMDEMKFDMGGAASVLGVFEALRHIQPKLNVIGVIPACENMPDGGATKPGDVVTSMSGQTIEILNTDAEGRLILCDALSYVDRFKPSTVIDIATLTGACVIALGAVRAGMFSTSDALADALSQAGETSGDLCWRMPLDDEYAEGLKSNFADMGNVAGRPAGSITAAKFLQKFIQKWPWAHLDIAGVAWKSGAAKGATGRPVGLLVQYLLAQQGKEA